MRELVAKQVKQRKAVAAAGQNAIRVSGTRFGGRQVLHLVYLHGDPYVVSESQLSALRDGGSPEDMELGPVADENHPFAGYP